MADPYAQEFTPELDENLLSRMRQKIQKQGVQDRGRGTREALERNLQGEAWEGSRRGSVDAGTLDAMANLEADFAYRRAGLQREERLAGVERGWRSEESQKGRQFEAEQSATDRALQERLARMGYDYNAEQRKKARREALMGAAGGAIGTYVGSKYGGAAGGAAGGQSGSAWGRYAAGGY